MAKLTVLRLRWAAFYASLVESETTSASNGGTSSMARGIPLLEEVRKAAGSRGSGPSPAELKMLEAANPRTAEIVADSELVQFLAESPVIWRKDLGAYFHFVQPQEMDREFLVSPRRQRSFHCAILDLEDSLKSELVRRELLDKLPEWQRQVVVYSLGLDGKYRHTPEQVAMMLQISTRDVQQVLLDTRDAALQCRIQALSTTLTSGETHYHVIPDEPIPH
jgi:hypothetical protein